VSDVFSSGREGDCDTFLMKEEENSLIICERRGAPLSQSSIYSPIVKRGEEVTGQRFARTQQRDASLSLDHRSLCTYVGEIHPPRVAKL